MTGRQRDIVQFIAEDRHARQIATILKVSPKSIEYHRMKLMAGLNVHDIPGLVRFALQAGLIPEEKLPARGQRKTPLVSMALA